MDLYKAGCFILEAKRTPDVLRAKGGVGGGGGKGKRPMIHAPGLPGLVEEPQVPGYRANATYDAKLELAFIQSIRYAMALGLQGPPPPFLIVCDIGHSFHLWNRYDPKAGGGYGGFGARRIVMLDELVQPDIQQLFRDIWTNPKALDTNRRIAQVTRGIATELGGLAKELRSSTRSKDEVAHFLMRCVFTCFAEDINLLPGKPFTEGLLQLEKDPDQAGTFLGDWWKVMDEGGKWGWKRVLRFNGGLFKDSSVPPLSQRQIALLRMAAEKDWQEVEPAIFGTLKRLEDLGEGFSAFDLSHERISPKQFKGIELNPWAAGISELVLWIAYLQWFRRRHPAGTPPEPVLQNYGSIQDRDAVLAWDAEEATGGSRWDGKTHKVDARGREVPDENARTHTTRLRNPRPALRPHHQQQPQPGAPARRHLLSLFITVHHRRKNKINR